MCHFWVFYTLFCLYFAGSDIDPMIIPRSISVVQYCKVLLILLQGSNNNYLNTWFSFLPSAASPPTSSLPLPCLRNGFFDWHFPWLSTTLMLLWWPSQGLGIIPLHLPWLEVPHLFCQVWMYRNQMDSSDQHSFSSCQPPLHTCWVIKALWGSN